MKNLASRLVDSHYFWLSFASLIVISPLILLGHPGYYGDDFNMIQGLSKWGLYGSISEWIGAYGWAYRPIGISLMYIFYHSLNSNPFIFYLIYQLSYLAIGWFLYHYLFKLTSKKSLSLFVAIFFLFFPFNPTAFWQLASLHMIIVATLILPLIDGIINKSESNQYKFIFFYSFCWMLLLFSYEQIVGLIAVIILIIWIKGLNNGIFKALRKSLLNSLMLITVTLVFLLSYFLQEQNAKIANLNMIKTEQQLSQNINSEIKVSNNVESKEFLISKGRIESTLDRLFKVSKYFASSFSYATLKIFDSGIKGLFLFIILIFFASMTLMFEFNHGDKFFSISIIAIGSLWFIVTIAPFFLYPQANIPPYTLMLPSIGIGLAVYGFFSLLSSFFNLVMFKYIARLLLFFSALTFPLFQYGYYFGINEELSYWENIADRIQNHKNDLLKGNTLILHNFPNKGNKHIFWLEKTYAHRHLRDSLDQSLPKFKVKSSKKSINISLHHNEGESGEIIQINSN